jgi:adenine deaminase
MIYTKMAAKIDRSRVLAVARGEAPADLVITGCEVVNVFTGETLAQEVAIADGLIASVGEPRDGEERLELDGKYLIPGLIDAHMHLESSMVTPFELARAIVPRGVTTVVGDPHEIANVAGLDGIEWLLSASQDLPLTVLINAPSCVPATHLSTAGASLDHQALAELLDHPRVVGLAEVMNVPGVVYCDPEVHAKLDAFDGRPIDGHAPGLSRGWLNAYVAAGIGSDHECMTVVEAAEKLRLGMRIFLRESTGAKNLVDLLPAVSTATSQRCALCTDDRHPHDLLDEGHIDHLLRLAVTSSLDPLTAVQMATVNVAEAFALKDRGAIAPGRRADLVICRDLNDFHADLVISRGKLVGENGKPIGSWKKPQTEDSAVHGRMVVDLEKLDLRVLATGRMVRVIGIIPGQLVTESLQLMLPEREGFLQTDPVHDTVKLAVVERHCGTGNVGLGFVKGLGLRRGAIAGTVAHDHHNLIVAGADDVSMLRAAAEVARMGGGLAAVHHDRVLASLPLPVAGLMSELPVEQVRDRLDWLLAASRELGLTVPDPFMTLSFLGLEVIPALKLTDKGLVDVDRFDVVPLT